MKAQIPAHVLQALARIMRITGHTADDQMAVVLGFPRPDTNWVKFIRRGTAAGLEISKQITTGRNGKPTFTWRLSVFHPGALLAALNAYRAPAPPEEDPRPLDGREVISCPGFDDVMNVFMVDGVDTGEQIIYGLPKGNLPWKDVVEGLLASGRALDVTKTYFVDETDGKVKHVWRVAWKPDAKPVPMPAPSKPQRDIHKEVGLPQRSASDLEDANREATEKALQMYRERHGMTQGPDGKWRVPLDPYGRVTKVVLFNPERACYVPGIDYSKTGEVTREMIEKPEQKS